MADEIIVVEPIIPVINVINETPTITVSAPGPQGAPGTFDSSDIFYTHTQAVSASVWTINHNLNGYPTAVVLDSAGTMCEGTFSYPSVNQMIITFSSAFTGTAYII
jgi:hypothetical protein